MRVLKVCASVGLLICALGCRAILCSYDRQESDASPSGRDVAMFVIQNCGATTDYLSLVYLQDFGSAYSPANVDESKMVFAIDGWQEIDLTWKGPNILEITCRQVSGIPRLRRDRVRDVTVEYVDCPSTLK